MKQKKLSEISLVFMGTSTFAATILEALQKENSHILSVYTQTEKPSGREHSMKKSPVALVAEKYALRLSAPQKLDENVIEEIRALKPEVLIVAAYGKILPESILNIPPMGAINVHGSLLPKYRGASPIQNALLHDEKETGITLIKMDKGIDTGDILSQSSIKIDPEETVDQLEERLADLGAKLLTETLPPYLNGQISPLPQDDYCASYCSRFKREDGMINWQEEAKNIFCRYRACAGWPEIFTFWNGKRLKLKKISLATKISDFQNKLPGTVFALGDSVLVTAKNGALVLKEVQLEGKNKMAITDFVRGYKNFIGSQLK